MLGAVSVSLPSSQLSWRLPGWVLEGPEGTFVQPLLHMQILNSVERDKGGEETEEFSAKSWQHYGPDNPAIAAQVFPSPTY